MYSANLHISRIGIVCCQTGHWFATACVLTVLAVAYSVRAEVAIYENVFEGEMQWPGWSWSEYECHAFGPYGSPTLSFSIQQELSGTTVTTTLIARDRTWYGPIVELDHDYDYYYGENGEYANCVYDVRAAWIVTDSDWEEITADCTINSSSVFKDESTGRYIREEPYTFTSHMDESTILYLCFCHPNGSTLGWVELNISLGYVSIESSCIATGVKSIFTGTTEHTIDPATLLEGGIRQLDIFVDASVPVSGTGLCWESPFKSIQEAVDAVRLDGTTVHVKPGVYGTVTVNNEKFTKNNLSSTFTVQSTDGPEKTIIDGGGLTEYGARTMSCFWYGSDQVPLVDTVRGFTLCNSLYGAYYGNVEDCIVSNCAWGVMHGSAYNCLITDIKNIGFGGQGLRNCTVTRNNTGITIAKAANSIIWGNVRDNAYDSSFRDATNCCIPVVPTVGKYDLVLVGPGNIMKDPRFVDADAGDFRLRPDSPCIDAGLSGYASGTTDLAGGARVRGSGIDIGCFEFVPTVFDTNATHGVMVSPEWLERHYGLNRTTSSDAAYQAASLAETKNPRDGTVAGGKLAAWESYLWDLDPADSNQMAHAEIAMVDGNPQVSIVPASSNRVYTLLGKESLGAKDWARSSDFSDATFLATNRFFKVSVDLK